MVWYGFEWRYAVLYYGMRAAHVIRSAISCSIHCTCTNYVLRMVSCYLRTRREFWSTAVQYSWYFVPFSFSIIGVRECDNDGMACFHGQVFLRRHGRHVCAFEFFLYVFFYCVSSQGRTVSMLGAAVFDDVCTGCCGAPWFDPKKIQVRCGRCVRGIMYV